MDGEPHVTNCNERLEGDFSGFLVECDLRADDADFPEYRHGFEWTGATQVGAPDDAAALHLKISLHDFGPGKAVFAVANAAAFFNEFACRDAQDFRGHRFALRDGFAAGLHYRAAHQGGGAAGAGGAFEKHDRRIGAEYFYFLQRHAHLFRGNLRENGVTSLADLGTPAEHGQGPIRIDLYHRESDRMCSGIAARATYGTAMLRRQRAIRAQRLGGNANVAGNVRIDGAQPRMNGLAAVGQIAKAEFLRIAADFEGEFVHLRFHGEGDLRRAQATIGTCGNRVRVDCKAVDLHVGKTIRTDDAIGRFAANHRTIFRIRSGIQMNGGLLGKEFAIAIGGGADVNARIV